MSPEVALLHETWNIVKSHIHSKERVEVAESLLRVFDEHIDMEDIEVYKNEFDKAMKTAILSYYDEYEDSDEEWE